MNGPANQWHVKIYMKERIRKRETLCVQTYLHTHRDTHSREMFRKLDRKSNGIRETRQAVQENIHYLVQRENEDVKPNVHG